MKQMLVTGSSGLIGSEVCKYFGKEGWQIHGIDNNQRSIFFGPKGDTTWNLSIIKKELQNFKHYDIDIRERQGIIELIKQIKPDAIVHAAAQPSHDKAADIPFDDFEVNAVGTLNLLEGLRQYNTEIPFVHLSTNKVYGDGPNEISLVEKETRWDYDDPKYIDGISENFRIDQSKHSLFGASKVAADILVQEYGRYFNMPTVCLRGGCLTGPNHSGVELHGFLSYLVKCNLEHKKYIVYGYKGKQVRDNIHSYDVVRFIDEFLGAPKSAAVYNLGGGKKNSCSILESFGIVEKITGNVMKFEMSEINRIGDHICYYSDLTKMKCDYPQWDITIDLNSIFEELVYSWDKRLSL